MADRYLRHTLVWPRLVAWDRLMAARPDLSGDLVTKDWAAAGYPLVVRRRVDGDPENAVPLGLPLPPTYGKRRIGLSLKSDDIVRSEPPPLLADAIGSAPATWRETIERLLGLDASTRTFGSLAWQHLTSLLYISAASDIDMVWEFPAGGDVRGHAASVAAIEQTSPTRLDGEIVIAGAAVHWRECLGGGDVLVKRMTGLRMADLDAFASGRCS